MSADNETKRMTSRERIPRSFFEQTTLEVAKSLLGQRLVRLEGNQNRLSGIIIETEAYVGMDDLACHAKSGKTMRNHSMWGPAGIAYVYFTYGMHWMLNFVTERDGYPAAVLIRAIVPVEGIQRMMARRPGRKLSDLVNGPAKLCQALNIDRSFDGHDACLSQSRLFVEQMEPRLIPRVTSGPRVGLNKVPEPWKSKPWRFMIAPESLSNNEIRLLP
jgi:DNA-3-methyladenine glycosylase